MEQLTADRRIYISGHRGTRVHAIENTRAAFEYCLQNGMDYIEFDVKRTSDNEIVVFHDGHVNRLLSGKGSFEQFSLAELREMTFADGQQIQTLAEFFEQVGKQLRPMLEIKSRHIGAQVIEIVHEFGYKGDEILIQSFIGKDLQECYQIDPQYDYGLCMAVLGKFRWWQKSIAHWFWKKFIKPVSFIKWLNLDGPFIYDEFINEVVGHDLHIILGANNTAKYLPKMDQWHVEIVNADDPTGIRELLIAQGYKVE